MQSLVVVALLLAVAARTPGPNNLIVMAAGARGGLRTAGPAIAGVIVGGLLLITVVWSGVAALLAGQPGLRAALALAGAAYLFWLGGQTILRGRAEHEERGRPLPLEWLAVAAFQFLNPKAWVLFVTASAALSSEFEGLPGLALLALLYTLRSVLSLSAWALGGAAIQGWSREGRARSWLHGSMGGLLVTSGLILLFGVL